MSAVCTKLADRFRPGAALHITNRERTPFRDGPATFDPRCPCRLSIDVSGTSRIDRSVGSGGITFRHCTGAEPRCSTALCCIRSETRVGVEAADDIGADVRVGSGTVGHGVLGMHFRRSERWLDTSGRTSTSSAPSRCLYRSHDAAVDCPSALATPATLGAIHHCHPEAAAR